VFDADVGQVLVWGLSVDSSEQADEVEFGETGLVGNIVEIYRRRKMAVDIEFGFNDPAIEVLFGIFVHLSLARPWAVSCETAALGTCLYLRLIRRLFFHQAEYCADHAADECSYKCCRYEIYKDGHESALPHIHKSQGLQLKTD